MDLGNGESTKKELLHRTIWWLKENYTFVEGISMPRQTLYENYLSYCKSCKYSSISTATFGKIIRQQFPQITTRRLGIRGNSKYHYHGLAVKETSIYYDLENLKGNLLSSTKTSPATNVQHPKNRNDSVPKIHLTNDILRTSANEDKSNSDMNNFFIMYQTHSQQIIDSIVHGSFEEIGKYLFSFWKSCPDHFTYLFDKEMLIDGVLIIDMQVYIAVHKFVLHSMNQTLPDQYLQQFVIFLNVYSTILDNVIPDTNTVLRNKKIFYALMFKQMCLGWLRGSHLYQIIFPVLCTTDFISQILEDFQSICLDNVIDDTINVLQVPVRVEAQKHFYNYFEQFENLLEIDFTFDSIMKWTKDVVDNDWIKMGLTHKDCFLAWSIFLSKFLQEMFISTTETFAQVNLVFIWLQHLFYTESIIREFQNVIVTSKDIPSSQLTLCYSKSTEVNSVNPLDSYYEKNTSFGESSNLYINGYSNHLGSPCYSFIQIPSKMHYLDSTDNNNCNFLDLS